MRTSIIAIFSLFLFLSLCSSEEDKAPKDEWGLEVFETEEPTLGGPEEDEEEDDLEEPTFESSDDLDIDSEPEAEAEETTPAPSMDYKPSPAPISNEWYGFDYKEVGITTAEFDMVKQSGMTRKELEQILEYGIMPTEYFSEPWKKLGVSKSYWMNAKKQGMEDSDMDRTLYTRTKFNWEPVAGFFLPGWFPYKTRRHVTGGIMTGIFVAGAVLTFVDQQETGTGNIDKGSEINLIYPCVCLASMLWSATDAYIGTRYVDNAEASRYSLNIIPSKSPKVVFSASF
jgi:hypothetical protein